MMLVDSVFSLFFFFFFKQKTAYELRIIDWSSDVCSSDLILPLLPDQAVGPFGVLNPRRIWIVVILVMAIGGTGHIAVRALGARFGLPLAGLDRKSVV